MPTFVASGSHHAPMPHRIRSGARSSSVENVLASRAALRVQMSMTPEPTLIRSVAAANAAIGTTASRTSRLSACQTASKPAASARLHELDALTDVVGVLQVQRDRVRVRFDGHDPASHSAPGDPRVTSGSSVGVAPADRTAG